MKTHFVVEVDSETMTARMVRINEEDHGILDAQISLGATPALKWTVRTRWMSLNDMVFELRDWIQDWAHRVETEVTVTSERGLI